MISPNMKTECNAILAKCRIKDPSRKGFVSPRDSERLLGYCKLLLKRKDLTTDDRAACERYLSNDRTLTVAEAERVGRMRRFYSRRKK